MIGVRIVVRDLVGNALTIPYQFNFAVDQHPGYMISGHVHDTGGSGMSKVEFYDGATLKATDSTSPYTYRWSVTSADAGIAIGASLVDTSLDAFRRLEKVNVDGALLTLTEAGRAFRQQNTGGDIIVISTKNFFSPGAGFGAYCTGFCTDLVRDPCFFCEIAGIFESRSGYLVLDGMLDPAVTSRVSSTAMPSYAPRYGTGKVALSLVHWEES